VWGYELKLPPLAGYGAELGHNCIIEKCIHVHNVSTANMEWPNILHEGFDHLQPSYVPHNKAAVVRQRPSDPQ